MKLAFVADDTRRASEAAGRLVERYGNVPVDQAEVIVSIGGDGHMLATLHRFLETGTPIYGLKKGAIGFLLNLYAEEGLVERIGKAQKANLRPLQMTAADTEGVVHSALAINEVSLLRQTRQAAKIRVLVNGREKIPELICDGILLATAAGSTAYNLSAHGPILPLGADLLALTPISPFRPRRWRGALLPRDVSVRFEVIEQAKRPVSATADATEVRDVQYVEISESKEHCLQLLFDPEHNLEERILNEQFVF
ncbi:MAG: NAD kinase [Lysobacteraceae bacterium]|nr:MAG: NAD kinase [Xanthomonadaceae bacterium]